MATGYAPEYSEENIGKLTSSYASLLEPETEKSRRLLAQSLAGTPGMYGTPRTAGLGEIEASRIGQIGQYAQNLAQTGLGAGREERLISEQRAYEDPYKQAGLTGMYGGQQTLAGRGQALSEELGRGGLAEQVASRQQQGTQFGQSLTEQVASRQAQNAIQNRTLELQQQGMTQDEAFRSAQLEQQGSQFQQQFGLSQQQLADALKTSEMNRQYYPTQFTGMLPTGEKTWEREQQEFETADQQSMRDYLRSKGLDPAMANLIQSLDPDAFKFILKGDKTAGSWLS